MFQCFGCPSTTLETDIFSVGLEKILCSDIIEVKFLKKSELSIRVKDFVQRYICG